MGSIAVLVIAAFLLYRYNKIKWAREKASPEIENLFNEEKRVAAFELAQKANSYIGKDQDFRELFNKLKSEVTILTDPSDASIYLREYSDTSGNWKSIGRTPVRDIELPVSSFYLMKIEKEGYENVLTVLPTELDTIFRKMFRKDSIPPGMIYVEGYKDEVTGNYFSEKNGFFIDRYEVTNKQFKEFVDKGGYRNREYWKHEFIKDGKTLSWEEAISQLTDLTGKQGPATWEIGDYPDGMANYPVSGISWYEAAAYAGYSGKTLPTGAHWGSAAGFFYKPIWDTFGSRIIPLSNLRGDGPEPVGKFHSINCFGTSDMAGNVREWCLNETTDGRLIVGGAWDGPNYMYSIWNQLPAFDRSPKNGFRCAKYIDSNKIPEHAFQLIDFSGTRDYTSEKPVNDEIFRYLKTSSYTTLNQYFS